TVVRYDKGAWWALVSYRQRDEGAAPDAPAAWLDQTERLGPFKRPRNAMMAAEERVLLLGRRHGDNVRFERIDTARQRELADALARPLPPARKRPVGVGFALLGLGDAHCGRPQHAVASARVRRQGAHSQRGA